MLRARLRRLLPGRQPPFTHIWHNAPTANANCRRMDRSPSRCRAPRSHGTSNIRAIFLLFALPGAGRARASSPSGSRCSPVRRRPCRCPGAQPPAERPSREPSERRVRTPCGYGSTAPTGTLETCVPTPAKRPDPSATSPAVQAVLSVLSNRVTTFAPGAVIGAGVYLETGRLWHALALACVIGAPTKAMQKVAAEWIELLRPPRRWRRPRRRGT